ncbi:uncharacterized protein LOC100838047 [Brachypodium distachyon]|uniref:uncharacterized protein LOC100838047 n=1 Tax=Brachypodium distachyon TaxID=15368 RepID=UPI0001D42F5B|nr:uncharacterized protein LOC100838047 [Brachypodium distachyon]|eukprot:XP_003560421.1 uncharacterized protein LOC100838047 [Brachypodium distachyon]
MDTALSAVASELTSRFVSFLISKYRNQACLKNKKNLESLRGLLLRVHTVVEEAEARHITNSKMLVQLKLLMEAMYQGYEALDTYSPLEQIRITDQSDQVSGSHTMEYFPIVTRRFNSSSSITVVSSSSKDVQSALENLEAAAANMAEFVTLLAGFDRMPRSPYSRYLFVDGFMFGRQVERQQIINILMLQDDVNLGAVPIMAVLPVIGGCRVGKKTLISSVCCDDRIRGRFSSILHVNGSEIREFDSTKFTSPPVRTLVVVELRSDIDDKEWHEFRSILTTLTSAGSKIVIISRLEKAARFGTVNNSPIRINGFSQEEYSYLFKVLAFGSADPGEHPRLALIGKELATMMQGSLVHLNVYSNMLRGNLSVQFWTRVLKLYKTVMEANLTSFGERPTALLQRGGVVDITEFSSSLSDNGSVRVMLLIAERVDGDSSSGGSGELLPKLGFGDIIAGSVALPMEFELVWESRLPPYTVISATCVARKAEHSAPPRKRCRRLSTPL